MSEVADFLQAHPPFDALDRAELERVAAVAETEHHAAGTTIFAQGAEPARHLRVVRTGAVELILDGRVIDLLEPGELLGHPSMLSGLPTGFAARAAVDTTCLRIPDDVAQELLAKPAGLLAALLGLFAVFFHRIAVGPKLPQPEPVVTERPDEAVTKRSEEP